MPEPTPPPERPLPAESRDRLRAELLAHAHDHPSGGPRWLVPAAAAAAVAVVAGLAFWVVGASHDGVGDPADRGDRGAASSVPETDRPSSEPSGAGTESPTAAESLPATPTATATEVGTQDCRTELRFVLKGAEQAFGDDELSYWVKGDRFSLCYRLDGSTTVTQPLPVTPVEEVASYRVASLFSPTADGYRTVRVAGGVVPAGALAFDVAYTFPDGHTEHATSARDATGRTWWRMVYSYDDGGGNETKKPPIEVTVSYSGTQRSYPLQWAEDTCAQANHGC